MRIFCSGFISSSIHNHYICRHAFPPHLIKGFGIFGAPSTVLCQCRHISPFKLDRLELKLGYTMWLEKSGWGAQEDPKDTMIVNAKRR